MCVCVINDYQHFFLQMGSPDSSICAKFNVDRTDAYAQGFLQVEEQKNLFCVLDQVSRCSRELQHSTR